MPGLLPLELKVPEVPVGRGNRSRTGLLCAGLFQYLYGRGILAIFGNSQGSVAVIVLSLSIRPGIQQGLDDSPVLVSGRCKMQRSVATRGFGLNVSTALQQSLDDRRVLVT